MYFHPLLKPFYSKIVWKGTNIVIKQWITTNTAQTNTTWWHGLEQQNNKKMLTENGWQTRRLASWWADRRHRSVWRASRIFFKTYLKETKLKIIMSLKSNQFDKTQWPPSLNEHQNSSFSPLLLSLMLNKQRRPKCTLPNLLQNLILLHSRKKKKMLNHPPHTKNSKKFNRFSMLENKMRKQITN